MEEGKPVLRGGSGVFLKSQWDFRRPVHHQELGQEEENELHRGRRGTHKAG